MHYHLVKFSSLKENDVTFILVNSVDLICLSVQTNSNEVKKRKPPLPYCFFYQTIRAEKKKENSKFGIIKHIFKNISYFFYVYKLYSLFYTQNNEDLFLVHLEKILNSEINSATCEVIYILLLPVNLNRLIFCDIPYY